MEISQAVARALLQIDGVGISKDNLITFKSGIKSPIYMDNRKFPFHPDEWKTVIAGFIQTIKDKKIKFDVIAGIEAAGIPHSAALGYALGKPSVFVRKETKDHGTKKMVEGGDVSGKKVLLIEDLVTMGLSSLHGVRALRKEGAIIQDCIVIASYGLKESEKAFREHQMRLHCLTSLSAILEQGQAMKKFSLDQISTVLDWMKNFDIR